MVFDELKYQIGITLIPKIGCINAKRLIAYCGGVEAVFKQNRRSLTKIPGIGNKIAHEVLNHDVLAQAEREVEFIHRHGITPLFYLDPHYPHRLRQCDDGPVMLYTKGIDSVNLDQAKVISIVGTRSITDYGKSMCENLVEQMSERGHSPLIVSGLAYGVDVCAHKAALRGGLHTAAVLGHGLDTIYPSVHREVARSIAKHGILVSDFPSKTAFDRNNFIRRNRIIAGLADATIVIESAEQGGALITADLAISYNRDVLAVPGAVGNKYSEGCNKLIKINRAALIESVLDIEYHLGWESPDDSPKQKQRTLFPTLSDDEQCVFNLLKTSGQEEIDFICHKTKMPVAKVSAILLSLEFAGLIKCKPGKVFAIL